MRQYGVGPITATTILCELGDVTRLSASRKAVRASGLDVGVYRSDRHTRTGRITRQGAPALRWALYHNFTPAQERRERKRTYKSAGRSPLARAGCGLGEVSYLDALAI